MPHRDSTAASALPTVWVLGDQLARHRGALAGKGPGDCRVLLVESEALVASARWHRQRLHLVLSAMAHFAEELRAEGFEVDHRRARSLRSGLDGHRAEFGPEYVEAMEPNSWDAWERLDAWGVRLVRNDLFLCHPSTFAEWAAGRTRLTMEDFYRWQRQRLDVLMTQDSGKAAPVGGRWKDRKSTRLNSSH